MWLLHLPQPKQWRCGLGHQCLRRRPILKGLCHGMPPGYDRSRGLQNGRRRVPLQSFMGWSEALRTPGSTLRWSLIDVLRLYNQCKHVLSRGLGTVEVELSAWSSVQAALPGCEDGNLDSSVPKPRVTRAFNMPTT